MPTAAPPPAPAARRSSCVPRPSRRPVRRSGSGRPAVAGGDEGAQGLDRGRRGPVTRPNHALDDVAVAIDHEGLGVTPDAVAIAHLVLGIEQDREREAHVLDEGLDRVATLLVLADGEEREAVALEV